VGVIDDVYSSVAGTADHLAGSTDESIARQFDDEEGGGFFDADTYRTEADRSNFGDGSNQWVPGTVETFRNLPDRLANPYDTVAGAADALTLNFDEGVGGLYSLVDDEPGNTAGPGDSSITNPEGGGPIYRLASVIIPVVLLIAGVWLVRPFVELLSVVLDDG
jgi:hypothetical protein